MNHRIRRQLGLGRPYSQLPPGGHAAGLGVLDGASYDAGVQPPESAFSISLTVQADDIDEFDHVNNVVYVRWVQDVAAAHWSHIAPERMRAAILWVVVRHEIDYLRPAWLGDQIVVRTWLGPRVDGIYERFTHVSRTKQSATTAYGGVTLARGRTLWCPIDSTNGRRIRELPADAERLFDDARQPG